MANRDIYLISGARLGSTRMYRKMIEPFWDGTTMFDLLLKKMKRLSGMYAFKGSAIALNKSDTALVAAAEREEMNIIFRSDKSAKAVDLDKIYDYLKDIDCEHFMWVNGSAPFWTPKTAARAAEAFAYSTMKSLTSVVKRQNWFWDLESSKSITCPDIGGATQHSKIILESTHSFHIFPKKTVLLDNRYWNFGKRDPYLFNVPSSECLVDVDTEEDFKVADAILMQKEVEK